MFTRTRVSSPLLVLLLPSVLTSGPHNLGPSHCLPCHPREAEVWKHTRHHASFDEIESHPRTGDLLKITGDATARGSATCALCHATLVPQAGSRAPGKPVSGPSCESCHGPASEWSPVHADSRDVTATLAADPALRADRRRRALEKGMLDHSQLLDIALRCMQCHGMNHPQLAPELAARLVAAGHPLEPTRELVRGAEGEVHHRFYPVPEGRANLRRTPAEIGKLFVLGQVVRLLSAHQALGRSADPGYHAAQLQRRELAREALSTLDEWPEVNAFLRDPTDLAARSIARRAETTGSEELLLALIPQARDDEGSSRRSLYEVVGMAPSAAPPPAPDPEPATPMDALERLLAGNLRFAAGKSRHRHEDAGWRRTLTGGQRPFAAVLACSDSRVPVELLFDQGFGDLFVIRVAGNVHSTDTAGSVLYAVHHLDVKLLFVMGHESCGAVTAALEYDPLASREPARIQELLELVTPALQGLDPDSPRENRLHEAIKQNVRLTVHKLRQDTEIQHLEAEGRLSIVGGVYEISSGRLFRITDP